MLKLVCQKDMVTWLLYALKLGARYSQAGWMTTRAKSVFVCLDGSQLNLWIQTHIPCDAWPAGCVF